MDKIAIRWLAAAKVSPAIALIFALAIALRIAASVPFAALHFDEIWQYLEPAWSLLGKPWVITWEQRDGLRSWLIPELLSGPMWLGNQLDPSGTGHLLAVRVALSIASLAMVAGFYRFGSRLSLSHALIACFVGAIWSEFILMAPRAMSEPIAAVAFVAGAAILLDGQNRRPAIGAGFLLCLSVLFRIQYAPALAMLLFVSRKDFQIPMFFLGAILAIILDSLANVAAGNPPLYWIWLNAIANGIQGKSNQFGVEPPWYYVWELILRWHIFLAPIAYLAWRGSKKYPQIAAAAVAHIAIHSLIPHKEWRFDYLFIVLVILLAAIGTGEIVQEGKKALALAGWTAASLIVMVAPQTRASFATLQDAYAIMRTPSKEYCPVAIVTPRFYYAGAYSMRNRADRLFLFVDKMDELPAAEANATSFGMIASNSTRFSFPSGFEDKRCFDNEFGSPRFCVAVNRLPCKGKPPEQFEINARFRALGI